MSPMLNADEKANLTHLATAGDQMAQVWVDHEAALANIRAGLEGELIIARFATTAPINLATTGLTAIDGVTPVAGNIALVKDQASAIQNGLYVVSAGAWSRVVDSTGGNVLKSGMVVSVSEGTAGADTLWTLTTNTGFVVGTNNIAFAQYVATGVSAGTLSAAGGAATIGIADTLGIIVATTVEGALAEIAGSRFHVNATLTTAEADAGKTLLADALVPSGKKVYVEGIQVSVGGATAWTATSSSTKLVFADGAGVPLVDVPLASLTGNALQAVLDGTNMVLKAAAMNGGSTATKGIAVRDDGTHDMSAGSTLSIAIWGRLL